MRRKADEHARIHAEGGGGREGWGRGGRWGGVGVWEGACTHEVSEERRQKGTRAYT